MSPQRSKALAGAFHRLVTARLYGRTIEIDHIVSLELGGSNDIANLYPDPGSGRANYHVKNRLENSLHPCAR